MTVNELLHRISSHELAEWMAFYSLEPFGYRADLHGHAITASIIAEVNRDREKRDEPFNPNEFLPNEESNTSIQEEIDDSNIFERLKDFLFGNRTGTSG